MFVFVKSHDMAYTKVCLPHPFRYLLKLLQIMHAGFEGRLEVCHSNMDAKVPLQHHDLSLNMLLVMPLFLLNFTPFFSYWTNVSALFLGHI
jgi:hypothetical protein